ncbi:syntaxin-11-like [Archocentrus centrarchus]|uniref:syntaxin-11-like n=1 Tax=Archocentrus centrarchus TaxID=63155 RepID=UPI0011EA4522|nr:syntaxin-11-like [Archocentrus centrarchus]
MRDKLERLQTIIEQQEVYEPNFYETQYDVDKATLTHQAVIFENSPAIEGILKEAESIRKDISLLHLEVARMCAHNERFATSVRRLTLLKKDCDSIARGIQQRGEALYARLQALGKQSKELEEKEGSSCAVSRIARAQYESLTRAFHDAMTDYNKAEEAQRNTCRVRIQRQASILGKEISDEQLDVLVDKGGEGWAELSQGLQNQGAPSCRMALSEIKGRHKELVELEARMKEVHELFLQMAILVEEQGSMLNNIEAHVYSTEEYIEKCNFHVKTAVQYKKKNPFLQCCPCLPCCKNNQIF